MKNKKIKPFLIYLAVSVLCVLLDLLTKHFAVKHLKGGEDIRILPHLINLTYVENRGAAWGMLADKRWVFMVISSIAIVLMIFIMYKFADQSKGFCIPLSLIVGGGIGNMIDRVFKGYVVDFLQFDFFKSFPVFNVADSFITVSSFAVCIYLIFFDKTILADKKAQSDADNNG